MLESYNHSLETVASRKIKFILLLILQLVSVSCSLFLFFRWITKSQSYRSLHNQTMTVLVCVNFFQIISDLSMTLEYLRNGQAPSSTFCLLWNFFAFSNYAVGVSVMTWTCLERHLLIFHDRLITTYSGKIFFHYIPLLISSVIPYLYYIYLVFFYPCENNFNKKSLFCQWCCYAYNNHTVLFNWLIFGVIPTCCISLLNLWFFIRVIARKRRLQQQINWRRHRRIMIQLISISSLYLLFDIPTVIVGLIQLLIPRFAIDFQTAYLYYIAYLSPLLIPIVCLGTFHEVWPKNLTKTNSYIFRKRLLFTKRNSKFQSSNHIIQMTSL